MRNALRIALPLGGEQASSLSIARGKQAAPSPVALPKLRPPKCLQRLPNASTDVYASASVSPSPSGKGLARATSERSEARCNGWLVPTTECRMFFLSRWERLGEGVPCRQHSLKAYTWLEALLFHGHPQPPARSPKPLLPARSHSARASYLSDYANSTQPRSRLLMEVSMLSKPA